MRKQPPSPKNGNQLPVGANKKGSKHKLTKEAEALGIPTKQLRSIKQAARVKFETVVEQANILMDQLQEKAYEQGGKMDEQEAKTFSTQLEALKASLDGKHSLAIEINNPLLDERKL